MRFFGNMQQRLMTIPVLLPSIIIVSTAKRTLKNEANKMNRNLPIRSVGEWRFDNLSERHLRAQELIHSPLPESKILSYIIGKRAFQS